MHSRMSVAVAAIVRRVNVASVAASVAKATVVRVVKAQHRVQVASAANVVKAVVVRVVKTVPQQAVVASVMHNRIKDLL